MNQRVSERAGSAGPPSGMADSKQRIREAALRLFVRHGYDGVSLQRIAREAGLHKSSVFHHYRYKVDLASEVFEDAVRELLERLEPLGEEDPPTLEGAMRVLDRVVDLLCQRPELARLIMSFVSAPAESDLNARVKADGNHPVYRCFGLISGWLKRAKQAGVIRNANTTETLFNVIGVVLFYPSAAESHWARSRPEPFSKQSRTLHKDELRRMVAGALAAR